MKPSECKFQSWGVNLSVNSKISLTFFCPKPISDWVSRTTVKHQMAAITVPLDFFTQVAKRCFFHGKASVYKVETKDNRIMILL